MTDQVKNFKVFRLGFCVFRLGPTMSITVNYERLKKSYIRCPIDSDLRIGVMQFRVQIKKTPTSPVK